MRLLNMILGVLYESLYPSHVVQSSSVFYPSLRCIVNLLRTLQPTKDESLLLLGGTHQLALLSNKTISRPTISYKCIDAITRLTQHSDQLHLFLPLPHSDTRVLLQL